MEQVKVFNCMVLWYKQFIDKIIYIVRFENMNKYLIMIILSIVSITSQAGVWIQTKICNTTGRDITLYKPLSSHQPTYANKDNMPDWWWWMPGSGPWRMFDDIRSSNYDNYVNSITIPSTTDCLNEKTTKTITIYDNNGGGNWDYMTLCDLDNNCKYGTYSLQFYNPSSTANAGVIPGYTYWDNDNNREICGEDGSPCTKFTQHASTVCRYISAINKNDSNESNYVYNCFVELF